ncbi:MAG: GIY-YIG nuclease family protein [Phycisphaeraceae bacterium]|nr:GIY-YIG nuclease family protein [Phycisphaeraceae bacterium]
MSRSNALVCQYIERLSSGMLEQYAHFVRDLVEGRHGVYALYNRDKLYYVGLATNLRGRLGSHLKDRHKGLWDRFSVYLTVNHGHIKELESLVIRIAQPKGNRKGGKFANSENLARSLRRLYRAHQAAEWAELIGKRRDKPIGREKRRGKARRKRTKEPKPALVRRFERAVPLRAVYRRKVYKARLRTNGTIRVGRESFNSPSAAGTAVVGRAVNGWSFWLYERAPGQWVRLRELRRK